MQPMPGNYAKIIEANLRLLYQTPIEQLSSTLPAERDGDCFVFEAFGDTCRIAPDGVFLCNRRETGVPGVLISLYARHAGPAPEIVAPLKAFKDLPNSMPYAGAFKTHTETPLTPLASRIEAAQSLLTHALQGEPSSHPAGGDFSFLVRPLPKISLGYIFYRADEEFAASVTCLFSNNAPEFMPIDGLADVGEYTSKKILALLDRPSPIYPQRK
jgi:Domain of unknown function (DUF3786)